MKQKELLWQNEWLKNDFCEECKLCCGPQGDDEPFPMPLLPRQLGNNSAERFYLLTPKVAYIGSKGCKSDSANGCMLNIQEKPVACNLFPVVLINGKLYLYQNCPASLFVPIADFMEIGKKMALWLQKFQLEELMHLSLTMDATILAAKFIDLHIKIFDNEAKKVILE